MKRTKNQVIWNASLRSWRLRCKANKTWAGACCRYLSHGLSLQATFPTALQPHLARIVLPAFARSRPADRPPHN